MLESLRDMLLEKIDENPLLVDADKKMEREAVQKKYTLYIESISEFFRSRIGYAIEHTLKYIEFGEFLDHIVDHDGDIEFVELEEMILSIFTEASAE